MVAAGMLLEERDSDQQKVDKLKKTIHDLEGKLARQEKTDPTPALRIQETKKELRTTRRALTMAEKELRPYAMCLTLLDDTIADEGERICRAGDSASSELTELSPSPRE